MAVYADDGYVEKAAAKLNNANEELHRLRHQSNWIKGRKWQKKHPRKGREKLAKEVSIAIKRVDRARWVLLGAQEAQQDRILRSDRVISIEVYLLKFYNFVRLICG